jgi:tRNA (uracil-5-)-methyltransferase TRM9
MDEETARRLHHLNLAFYRERAAEFSRTRERPWPGWQRLLAWLPETPPRVLDIGCGNARLARFLAAHRPDAHYEGIDASAPLLSEARARIPAGFDAILHEADFLEPASDDVLPRGTFSLVALFGVLHGVPGDARRRALVAAAAARLAAGGILALAGWRFAEFEDLRRRIVPWSALAARGGPAIDPSRVDPGDHLLSWGDGPALRYAHALDGAALADLTRGLRLAPVASYVDDGRDRARNHYAIYRAP